MKDDTGAGVSIISSEKYVKHFFSIPLTPCSTQLDTYTSSTIEVRGQEIGSIPYGRNWLHTIRLNGTDRILKLKFLTQTSQIPLTRNYIQRHPNVFKPGLCTMRKVTAKLA